MNEFENNYQEEMDFANEQAEAIIAKPGFFKRNANVFTHAGTAVLAAALAAAGTWFYNRHKRNKIKKELVIGLRAIAHNLDPNTAGTPLSITGHPQEIETANYIVANTAQLIEVLHTQIYGKVFNKNELAEWQAITNQLISIANLVQFNEKVVQ